MTAGLHQGGFAVTALEGTVNKVGLADEVGGRAAVGLPVDLRGRALLADDSVLRDDPRSETAMASDWPWVTYKEVMPRRF